MHLALEKNCWLVVSAGVATYKITCIDGREKAQLHRTTYDTRVPHLDIRC